MNLYNINMSKKDVFILKNEVIETILECTKKLKEQNKKDYFIGYLTEFHYLMSCLDKILHAEKIENNILSLYLSIDELNSLRLAVGNDSISDTRAKNSKAQHILDFLESEYDVILNNSNNDDDAVYYLLTKVPNFR